MPSHYKDKADRIHILIYELELLWKDYRTKIILLTVMFVKIITKQSILKHEMLRGGPLNGTVREALDFVNRVMNNKTPCLSILQVLEIRRIRTTIISIRLTQFFF